MFPDYILDDTLDDDTSEGGNSINDNDNENYNYNSIDNNDGNHFNDNDDNYDSKYDDGNDDQTTMISHLIFVHIYVHR